MIPNDKCQSESNSRRTSSDAKLQPKNEQMPTIEPDSVENIDSNEQHHVAEEEETEEVTSKKSSEREEKPQIFNIKYVVPSNLIIREHQTQQHTDEATVNFQESPKGK